jgi:hypothetical protein
VSTRPTRATVEGRAYLDLQRLARHTVRPTDELHQLYALEGFLERMTRSRHADGLVLKGALLLAAFDSRRPTRDVDLAARAMANDTAAIRRLIIEILDVPLDDGLRFDAAATTAAVIREGDEYSGVRVTVHGMLAVARLQFHVDVNVGDPITPEPQPVTLPRLLGGALRPIGYPLEMVLAEKIITAVQRGQANTRWRDLVDVARVVGHHRISGDRLMASVQAVANHRQTALEPLADVLDGFAERAQARWAQWRRRLRLEATAPASIGEPLAQIVEFADPVLRGEVSGRTWDPELRSWVKPDDLVSAT